MADLKLTVHADDLGLTLGITRDIFACHDHGILDSTSLVVNGHGVDEAIAGARNRPDLEIVLHVNLFEGKPLAPAADVDLLLGPEGAFRHGFVGIWAAYLRASEATRNHLRAQVRAEMEAQFTAFFDLFPNRADARVDSHNHFHMIPFVLDELLALAERFPISQLRLAREPFFVASDGNPPLLLGPNLAKHFLLNALSRAHRPRLAAKGIATNSYLIGVLHGGRATARAAAAALGRLAGRNLSGGVEVLFHPGQAGPEEEDVWAGRAGLYDFYGSPWRAREAETLKSAEFAELIARFRSPATPSS